MLNCQVYISVSIHQITTEMSCALFNCGRQHLSPGRVKWLGLGWVAVDSRHCHFSTLPALNLPRVSPMKLPFLVSPCLGFFSTHKKKNKDLSLTIHDVHDVGWNGVTRLSSWVFHTSVNQWLVSWWLMLVIYHPGSTFNMDYWISFWGSILVSSATRSIDRDSSMALSSNWGPAG